jgi:MFS transporter, putative metabolite:H+ symporter
MQKLGGLVAQGLSVAGAVLPFGTTGLAIAAPAVIALPLVALIVRESRGRDLRVLEGSRVERIGEVA